MHGNLSIDSYVSFFINWMPKDDDDDDEDDYSLEDVGLKFQPGIQAENHVATNIRSRV